MKMKPLSSIRSGQASAITGQGDQGGMAVVLVSSDTMLNLVQLPRFNLITTKPNIIIFLGSDMTKF